MGSIVSNESSDIFLKGEDFIIPLEFYKSKNNDDIGNNSIIAKLLNGTLDISYLFVYFYFILLYFIFNVFLCVFLSLFLKNRNIENDMVPDICTSIKSSNKNIFSIQFVFIIKCICIFLFFLFFKFSS